MSMKSLNELIPAHIMRKEITSSIAESMKIDRLPQLDLKAFPIALSNGPQENFLRYLVGFFEKM